MTHNLLGQAELPLVSRYFLEHSHATRMWNVCDRNKLTPNLHGPDNKGLPSIIARCTKEDDAEKITTALNAYINQT